MEATVEVASGSAPLVGRCTPAFAPVREAFLRNFTERGEVGASVCVIVDGVRVVDLAGGWADAARTASFRTDTLVNMYSAGKGVVAALLLRAVEAGVIGLDDPIAEVWPEFACGGKEQATIRHALTHRAGVPAIAEPLRDEDLWDWSRMTAALAATPAWWEPGSRITYHTNTFGHLVGEIVRRTTGRHPGAVLREIAEPIGADLWFGVPYSEQHRCAELIWAPPGGAFSTIDPRAIDDPAARLVALGYFNPPGYSSQGVVNLPQWRAMGIPSTGGHASASGLAEFYAALLRPGEILSSELLAQATRTQAAGPCPVLGEDVEFGLGFTPTTVRRPLGPNPRSFGHFGTGGALGFADPDANLAFGYVMNHCIPRWQSTRNRALIDATFESLAHLRIEQTEH